MYIIFHNLLNVTIEMVKITRQESIEFLTRVKNQVKTDQKALQKQVAIQEASVYDLKRKNKELNIVEGLILVLQSIKVDPLDLIETAPVPKKKQKALFKNPN